MFLLWGIGVCGLLVFEHSFKQELGEGSRHLQPTPWDKQQSEGEQGTPVSMEKVVAEPGYHNTSPLVWLTSCANEDKIVVEGWRWWH